MIDTINIYDKYSSSQNAVKIDCGYIWTLYFICQNYQLSPKNNVRVLHPKKKNFKKKKLYGPFLWMRFNCLKARATSRRQFTFYR